MKNPWYDEFLRLKIPFPAKLVYVAACLEPMSASDISGIMGMSRNTVDTHATYLRNMEWIVKRRTGRKILILPTAPAAVQVRYGKRLEDDLEMAVHAGEARMKLLVDEIQVCRDSLDNVRPSYLRSPLTRFNLEVDRLVRGEALWEYRGAQHLGPTKKYPDPKMAETTRINDLLKQGLCVEQGLTLIVVYKKDLSVEGILNLIPDHLRTWPMVEGPYLETIRQVCRNYQAMDTGEDSLPGEERSSRMRQL